MRLSRLLVLPSALIVGLAASAFAQEAAAPVGKPFVPSPGTVTPKAPPAGPDFGTVQDHYVRIGGSEFMTDGAAASGYTNTWNPGAFSFNWRSYFANGAVFQHVYAWVHAPGGASLDYAELDSCNTDPTAGHDLVMNVYSCDFTGGCNSTPVATITNAANSGCNGHSAGLALTVNNYANEYLLDVVWPFGGLTDGSIALGGAIIGYRYQVSPAPGSATFADVPPSDPGFQYIEALVASGITAGCGGGNYCPNATLTRRQMAVFLSKALGLYWGGY